jgi:TetR/AcrR family transcriptional regulator, fatty acid metabolism regulator protein
MNKLSTHIRKEQLIRGVLKVIARDGTKHLSVASVSREVGLVPSALYRHFHSKDQMLGAVLDYIIGRVQHNFHEIFEETEDPLLRIDLFVQRQLKIIKESPAIPTVVFSQGLFSEDAVRRKKIFGVFSQFRQSLTMMVKMGQRAGTIRSDLSAETVILLLVGIIQPAAMLYYLSNGHYDLERNGRRAWKLLKDMIQTKHK